MKIYNKIIMTIVLIGIAIALFSGWKYLSLSSSTNHYTVSVKENIHIDVENTNVHIESTEGLKDKAEVEIRAKGKYKSSDIAVKTENNNVDIKQVGRDKLFNLNLYFGSRLDIYVKLPPSRKYILNVSSQNGKVLINNINSKNITVASENGSIEMNRITGGELSAQSSSGAIRLVELSVSKVETETESGSSYLVFSDKLKQITGNSSSQSGAIDYVFHNDIKLDLRSSGKLKSEIDSDTTSSNKINLQSESGSMSFSRK